MLTCVGLFSQYCEVPALVRTEGMYTFPSFSYTSCKQGPACLCSLHIQAILINSDLTKTSVFLTLMTGFRSCYFCSLNFDDALSAVPFVRGKSSFVLYLLSLKVLILAVHTALSPTHTCSYQPFFNSCYALDSYIYIGHYSSSLT